MYSESAPDAVIHIDQAEPTDYSHRWGSVTDLPPRPRLQVYGHVTLVDYVELEAVSPPFGYNRF